MCPWMGRLSEVGGGSVITLNDFFLGNIRSFFEQGFGNLSAKYELLRNVQEEEGLFRVVREKGPSGAVRRKRPFVVVRGRKPFRVVRGRGHSGAVRRKIPFWICQGEGGATLKLSGGEGPSELSAKGILQSCQEEKAL